MSSLDVINLLGQSQRRPLLFDGTLQSIEFQSIPPGVGMVADVMVDLHARRQSRSPLIVLRQALAQFVSKGALPGERGSRVARLSSQLSKIVLVYGLGRDIAKKHFVKLHADMLDESIQGHPFVPHSPDTRFPIKMPDCKPVVSH